MEARAGLLIRLLLIRILLVLPGGRTELCINNKGATPTLSRNPGPLNMVAMTAVRTEIGVLTAITSHGSTLPVIGMELTQPPHHFSIPRSSKNPLTYQATSDPRTLGALSGRERVLFKDEPENLA
ncbi:hypothetical protein AVEN_244922-1 [Araneus ventricosus]|uniref:Uncharacterized protein n=1 Tax=Araneus ventricosus TaxID=182803 RepID=A0A4Y2R0M8_ARAVE|nr:hypothetical protein AVEN_244922-1 [Araneus ventricosus]